MTNINKEHETSQGYVTSGIEYDGKYGPLIDLGLGKSPIGGTPELEELLAKRDPYHFLKDYAPDPNHTEIRALIVNHIGLSGLGPEAVVLNGNGSYGAGDEVVRYLARKRDVKKIIVPTYSFPNVDQWADRHGLKYVPIHHPSGSLDPLDSQKEIASLPRSALSDSVVYIDWPNNPYGNAELGLVQEVIKRVADLGGVPLIDLAFAEVLGQEYETVAQTSLENGGICIGSITKTQGFPDLRAGWAILPTSMTQDGYTPKQRLVFGISSEAAFVCRHLFQPTNGATLAKKHALNVSLYNTNTNRRLYTLLEHYGLTVHPTLMETSIQVVSSHHKNLYQRLLRVGIKTESLADYSTTLLSPGYGDSAVRLLTPPPNLFDEIARRLEEAVK